MARSTFTPRIAGEILRRIANGESLNKICGPSRKKGLPERATVYNWLAQHDNFKRAFLEARRAQADLYADDVVDIADGKDEGAAEPRDVRRDRLRVETRRWRAAILSPRLFGEKAALVGEEASTPERLEKQAHAAAKIAALLEVGRRRRDGDGD